MTKAFTPISLTTLINEMREEIDAHAMRTPVMHWNHQWYDEQVRREATMSDSDLINEYRSQQAGHTVASVGDVMYPSHSPLSNKMGRVLAVDYVIKTRTISRYVLNAQGHQTGKIEAKATVRYAERVYTIQPIKGKVYEADSRMYLRRYDHLVDDHERKAKKHRDRLQAVWSLPTPISPVLTPKPQ